MTDRGDENSIVDKASKLVSGDRADAYGDNCMKNWGAALEAVFGWQCDGHRAAIALVLLKLVREGYSPREDNRVDAVGYMILADREVKRES